MRPLPSEEATPPVTKMCFVCSTTGFNSTSSGPRLAATAATRDLARTSAPTPARPYGPSGSAAAALAAGAGGLRAQLRVGQQRVDRAGEALPRRPTATSRPDAVDEVAQPTDVAGHDRHACGHRLLDDEGPGLPGAGRTKTSAARSSCGRVVAGTDQLDRGAGATDLLLQAACAGPGRRPPRRRQRHGARARCRRRRRGSPGPSAGRCARRSGPGAAGRRRSRAAAAAGRMAACGRTEEPARQVGAARVVEHRLRQQRRHLG